MYELRCSLPRRTEHIRAQLEARDRAVAFLIQTTRKRPTDLLADAERLPQVADGCAGTPRVVRLCDG